MSLIRWSDRFFPRFPSMVEDFFGDDFNGFTRVEFPAVNVSETETQFNFEIAAPGMSKEDFNIEIQENMLVLSAKAETKTESKEKNYRRKEYSYRSFKRSFWLPENALKEEIEAKYEDGVLRLSIPKSTVAPKEAVKRIEIS